jgi:hypothetical protein
MSRTLLLAFAALTALAADDPWAKVRDLHSGVELRIFKKGDAKPVLAKMDQATEDKLLCVVKNEQVAIPKSDIDRVEARPSEKARVNRETKVKTSDPDLRPAPMANAPTPGTSYSSSVSLGGKADFETVYRRQTPPPGAAPQK